MVVSICGPIANLTPDVPVSFPVRQYCHERGLQTLPRDTTLALFPQGHTVKFLFLPPTGAEGIGRLGCLRASVPLSRKKIRLKISSQSKAVQPRTFFCSCDLDVGPITFMYKL